MSATPSNISLSDLPEIGDRGGILKFAQSFNGYEYHGSFEACAEVARARRRETLVDLRTELFASFRASHHTDTDAYIELYSELLPHFRRLLGG